MQKHIYHLYVKVYMYFMYIYTILALKWMATSLVKLQGTPNASLGFSLDLALSFWEGFSWATGWGGK